MPRGSGIPATASVVGTYGARAARASRTRAGPRDAWAAPGVPQLVPRHRSSSFRSRRRGRVDDAIEEQRDVEAERSGGRQRLGTDDRRRDELRPRRVKTVRSSASAASRSSPYASARSRAQASGRADRSRTCARLPAAAGNAGEPPAQVNPSPRGIETERSSGPPSRAVSSACRDAALGARDEAEHRSRQAVGPERHEGDAGHRDAGSGSRDTGARLRRPSASVIATSTGAPPPPLDTNSATNSGPDAATSAQRRFEARAARRPRPPALQRLRRARATKRVPGLGLRSSWSKPGSSGAPAAKSGDQVRGSRRVSGCAERHAQAGFRQRQRLCVTTSLADARHAGAAASRAARWRCSTPGRARASPPRPAAAAARRPRRQHQRVGRERHAALADAERELQLAGAAVLPSRSAGSSRRPGRSARSSNSNSSVFESPGRSVSMRRRAARRPASAPLRRLRVERHGDVVRHALADVRDGGEQLERLAVAHRRRAP